MPEKLTRSTQRNVAWQTDSEYHRLTAPSGRILNYVSFVRKVQSPEIFASPPRISVQTILYTCSRKGTEFLFNNLFINVAFIYFIIFVTSDYITLRPSAWGRELRREYDAIASLLCSYACYSLQASQLVNRPPCRNDTLNSVPHNKCSFPKKTVLESG